jgi:hypothetical protein
VIGDEPREPDEPVADIRTETQRTLDRLLDDIARNALLPVRIAMQEIVDRVDVEFALVGGKSQRCGGGCGHGCSPVGG